VSEPRKTRDGSHIVAVDDLRVGDRLRATNGSRATWWPILEIAEYPKTRRVTIGVQSTGQILDRTRMRRTTLVARAPRAEETNRA
jgi:hypothetical protein